MINWNIVSLQYKYCIFVLLRYNWSFSSFILYFNMILDLKNLSSFFYEMWMYISPKGLLAESHDLIYNIFSSSGYEVPSCLHLVSVYLWNCVNMLQWRATGACEAMACSVLVPCRGSCLWFIKEALKRRNHYNKTKRMQGIQLSSQWAV